MFADWLRQLFPPDIPPDPIDHPALLRMSPDELADLPLWPLDTEADQTDATVTSAVTELAI
jgi:hypothetical protein